MDVYSHKSVFKYVLGAPQNRLSENVLLSTQNRFWLSYKKIEE